LPDRIIRSLRHRAVSPWLDSRILSSDRLAHRRGGPVFRAVRVPYWRHPARPQACRKLLQGVLDPACGSHHAGLLPSASYLLCGASTQAPAQSALARRLSVQQYDGALDLPIVRAEFRAIPGRRGRRCSLGREHLVAGDRGTVLPAAAAVDLPHEPPIPDDSGRRLHRRGAAGAGLPLASLGALGRRLFPASWTHGPADVRPSRSLDAAHRSPCCNATADRSTLSRLHWLSS